ncbi:MAG: molybdate ABC transporter permease subunit [Eggerthellaceae bacterium]|nr:molybdate ABC transporter permease subunit [Eggerthellaceae bacterium]
MMVAALVLIVATMVAPAAYAADMEAAPMTKADVSTDDVVVSADSDDLTAVIDGCDFAVGNFERASKGSNRNIADAYHGYAYYIGSKSDTLMYLVTSENVVVYADAAAAKAAGFDLESSDDVARLQQIIVMLDKTAGGGGALIGQNATWYFTTEQENEINGVLYEFNQVIDGSAYNLVVGKDGSDVTDTANPNYVQTSFACFAALIPASEAVIAAEPSWFESLGTFMSKLDWSPLFVTLRTTFTAIVFIFILGLAAAYFCLHRTAKFRNLFDTIFTIPMVLPPTVCGFLLLLALGSNTPVGQWFIDIGFPLIFSWPATVIAAVVVAFPLMYRGALGAFDNLDPNMLDAARTLGWSESKIFFKIMLPLSWSSIAASTVLAFARALGEFGATLFLAGNYLGITRTIPIAIYFEWMNGNTDIAIFWTIILIIFSFIVIMFINLWSQHTTRYRKGAVEE